MLLSRVGGRIFFRGKLFCSNFITSGLVILIEDLGLFSDIGRGWYSVLVSSREFGIFGGIV